MFFLHKTIVFDTIRHNKTFSAEGVNYTSATFNKRKTKRYKNKFGLFLCRDIPKETFPYFVKVYEYETYSYFIASPEKALCDMLYILPPAKSLRDLKGYFLMILELMNIIFKN